MTYKELAAAIRRGHTMIGERGTYLACGAGCALAAGVVGAEILPVSGFFNGVDEAARLLGIKESLARKISTMHSLGAPRLFIANWLDSPEEPGESNDAYYQRVMNEITEKVTA